MQGLRGLSRAEMVATSERSKHLNAQGDGLSWERGPIRDRLKSTSDLVVPLYHRSGFVLH